MLKYKSIFYVLFTLVLFLLVFEKCVQPPAPAKAIIYDSKGQAFAGTASCRSCHQSIHDHFILTAHNQSSQPATTVSVKGTTTPGYNFYRYDYYRSVDVQQTDSGLTQVEYYAGTQKEAHRMDIIIGSGTRGQSYLYWLNHTLFQLPLSYFTASNTWANSPGFSPYTISFSRPIGARCLECHMTSLKQLNKSPSFAVLQPDQMIYGISCEKCHGPAARHVAFHKENPKETTGKFIVRNGSLTRQQQLDLCALCHSGKINNIKPSFQFSAGDTLADFFDEQPTTMTDTASLDVHGNQYGLLQKSKCFRVSQTMTCSNCHNTHNQERGMLKIFSARCMTCHSVTHNNFCKEYAVLGEAIRNNCIDCHMPVKSSRALTVQLEGSVQKIPATLRSHYIAIYKAETEKMMPYFKKSN